MMLQFFTESRARHPECSAHLHLHAHTQTSHGLSHFKLAIKTPCHPLCCVLLRPLSAVTDRMTGGRCYESCLGWWPHSWVPPAPHLGTPAASHTSQSRRARRERRASLTQRSWDSKEIIQDGKEDAEYGCVPDSQT